MCVALLGACAVVIALFVAFIRGEGQENRYADYADAPASQRRGWLPAMLPRSAAELHEWHDVDTNACVGSFRFDPKERPWIEVTLHPGLRRTIRIDRDPSFASRLPRDPNEQQLLSAGFQFYTEQDFDLAISWKAGVAYFWN